LQRPGSGRNASRIDCANDYLAEGGATAKEIASVSGHKSLREIRRYTKKADQRRLSQATMNKLETPKSV
jgi:hypothetical protein